MEENKLTKKELNNRRSIIVLSITLLICISAPIIVKAEPLPFVLQNMIVILAAVVFGGMQTAGSVGLFLAAGLFGLPVFAGGARGVAHLSTIRGSFLLGYFVASLVIGFMMKTPTVEEKTPIEKIVSSCVAGYVIIYILPLLKMFDNGLVLFAETVPKLLPYFIADFIKCIITIPLAVILRPIIAKKLN